MQIEGFAQVQPIIGRVSFLRKGFITIHLKDGRVLMAPLRQFPSIEKLTPVQRRRLTIADDQLLIFQDCNEIFHLEQFLGREQQYKYKIVS